MNIGFQRKTVRRFILKFSIGIIITLMLFWIPWLSAFFQHYEAVYTDVTETPEVQAIVIFGTLVPANGEISPLLRERLHAGIAASKQFPEAQLIVSNMPQAAKIMEGYILEQGISPSLLKRDESADKTSDTCQFLREQKLQNVLFVSQSFHLPRIFYLCNLQGVEGFGLAAEHFSDPDTESSFLEKVFVRSKRYLREAALLWMSLLGLYEAI